mgnify:FL=1
MLGDGPANLIPTSDFETGSGAWGGWGPNTSRGRTADGGGFGGAAIALIEKSLVPELSEKIKAGFLAKGYASPNIFSVQADSGAKREL